MADVVKMMVDGVREKNKLDPVKLCVAVGKA